MSTDPHVAQPSRAPVSTIINDLTRLPGRSHRRSAAFRVFWRQAFPCSLEHVAKPLVAPGSCPSPIHLRYQRGSLTHSGHRGEAPGEDIPHFDQGHRAEFTQRVQQIELPQA